MLLRPGDAPSVHFTAHPTTVSLKPTAAATNDDIEDHGRLKRWLTYQPLHIWCSLWVEESLLRRDDLLRTIFDAETWSKTR